MAPSTPAQRCLPSDRTIALAIAVVKSKPEDLTIREYIDILRKHVVTGPRCRNAKTASSRYFDSASYWHSQYQRLKGSLKAAQGDTIDLKMEIESLQDQLKENRPKTATRKRKQDEDIVRVERIPKRVRAFSLSTQQPAGSLSREENIDCFGSGTVENDLMRSFYNLNSILNKYQETDPMLLAQRCVAAAATVSQLVCHASRSEAQANSKRPFALKEALTAASRVMLCLTMGLNRVARASKGTNTRGKVLCAYVHMFSQIFEALSELAAKSGTTSAPQRVQEVLTLVTTFLCDMLKGLNSSMEAHRELFEGYAYVILRRVGAALHTSVFGHLRAETLAAEIEMSGEDSISKEGSSHETTCEMKALAIEAHFLVRTLECTLSLAPAFIEGASHTNSRVANTTKTTEAIRTFLSNGARQKLQRTLVACMFGAENAKQDESTQDCLRMPVMSDAEEIIPPASGTDVSEWFVEEVWRLVGWDILSEEAIPSI